MLEVSLSFYWQLNIWQLIFKDLMNGKEFLNSDQTHFTNSLTSEYVRQFNVNQEKKFKSFFKGW